MEVTLPYLIFHFEPHFEHRDAWVGGGELVKEVDLRDTNDQKLEDQKANKET